MKKTKKKRFAKKEFRRWLDVLTALAVKTRDNFTCRIGRNGCSGRMVPGDRNCQWMHIRSRSANNLRWDLLNALTACGSCHKWAHDNPAAFGVWLIQNYPYIWAYVNETRVHRTWRQSDYEQVETGILSKLKDLNADPSHITESSGWRQRLIKKLKNVA